MKPQLKLGSFVVGSNKIYFLHSNNVSQFIIIYQDGCLFPGPYKPRESWNYVR